MSPSPDTDSPFLLNLDMEPSAPDFSLERRLARDGADRIAGIDEAGRGPLAGPVVAAAVILDQDNTPNGLNDSKKLSAGARDKLFDEIVQSSLIAWSAISAAHIDRVNILQATLIAMTRAANLLPVTADAMLIDGRDVPTGLRGSSKAVIRGDRMSQSIAAASIVAKVVRDRIMIRADEEFPGYGFAGNKGYGTKVHLDAIREYGPCHIHRRSFAPISNLQDQDSNKKGAARKEQRLDLVNPDGP